MFYDNKEWPRQYYWGAWAPMHALVDPDYKLELPLDDFWRRCAAVRVAFALSNNHTLPFESE